MVHLEYLREGQDRTNEHLKTLNGRTGTVERVVESLQRDVQRIDGQARVIPMPGPPPVPSLPSFTTGQKAAIGSTLTVFGMGAVDMLTHAFQFARELLKAMGK